MKNNPTLNWSTLAKYYYSTGALVYSIVLPAIAAALWVVAGLLVPAAKESNLVGLAICWVTAGLIAWVLPEPVDYPGAGKRILTKEEFVGALFAGPLTLLVILGAKCLM